MLTSRLSIEYLALALKPVNGFVLTPTLPWKTWATKSGDPALVAVGLYVPVVVL